jgi:hypothetical protein
MAANPKASKTDWLLVAKEAVTALLAIGIVGYTLVMAERTFSMAGDATRMGDAKDILIFLGGFAGVVVGYYFGRIPADARASQAQEQVEQAVSDRADAMGKMADMKQELAGLEDKARSGAQVVPEDVRKVREMSGG